MLGKIVIRLYVKENTEVFEIINAQNKNLISRFAFPLGRSFVDLYYSDYKSFYKLMGDTNPILKHMKDNDLSANKLSELSDKEIEVAITGHRISKGLDSDALNLQAMADKLPEHHVFYYIYRKYLYDVLYDFTVNKKRITSYKNLSHNRHNIPKLNGLIKFLIDECFDINIDDKVSLKERIDHFYSDSKYEDVKYDFRKFEFNIPTTNYSYFPNHEYEYNIFEDKEMKLYPEIYVQSFKDITNFLIIQLFQNGTKFNTCKNCGKYFVLEGHKSVEYCDRPVDDTGKTCKDVGAMATYRNKKNDDPIFKVYNKAYKTKNARIRYGRINRDEFKTWSKHAREMRDKAYAGEITYEHLVSWLKTDLGFEEELTLF
jgi:hypothetical protein